MIKLNKRSFTFLIAAIVLITAVLMVMLIGSMGGNNAYADETTNAELLIKLNEVTKDTLIEVNNQVKCICNYSNYLESRFQLSNNRYDVQNIEDEWILKIIPIELFKQKQEFFYIGNAYGFYLNYDNSSQRYLVYLILNVYAYNDGMLSRVIRPLYYEQYVFNEQTEKVSLVYTDYYVYPDPQNLYNRQHYYHYRKHSNYEKLYLKDVNFTGSLYNENQLNIDENGYNKYQDNGGYFVQSQYKFKGVSTQSGKMDFANAVLQMGLGYLPLGTSGLSVGGVLNTATAITELGAHINDAIADFRGVVSNEDLYKHSVFSGMSRDIQICKFGNLLKASASKFHTNNTHDAVLLGINSDNYARNEWLINYYNQENKWNTRFVGNVSLDIVKETTSLVGSTVTEIANDITAITPSTYSIDNGETTQLSEDVEKEIYILKDAKHRVSFEAPINGRFTISTSGEVANDIDVAQGSIISKEASGNNKKVVFYLKKNEDIDLNVFKNNVNSENLLSIKVEFTPEILNKGEEKSVIISPNEMEYFAYFLETVDALDYYITATNSIAFDLSHQNRINNKFYTTGENIFGSFIFSEGKYFIGIQNNSDIPLPVSVTLRDAAIVYPEEKNAVELVYTKILELDINFTSGIEVSVESEAPILIELYDESNTLIAESSNSIVKVLKTNVVANKKYYILLKNISHQLVEANVEVTWDSYILSIGNNNISSVTSDRLFLFTPPINAEYEITSNVNYTIYNSEFEILGSNLNTYIHFENTKTYLFVVNGDIANCTIEINLKHTNNTSGSFTESGTEFIKFIPTRTAVYIVSGSNSFTWYNESLQPVNAYLYANYTYYLKIDGNSGNEYDVSISVNSNQIPIRTTVSINSGSYFFRITQSGTYTIRTFCANNVSSTLDIYDGNGLILYPNVNADTIMFAMELEPGLYYIDLNVSTQEKVGVRINKNL